MPGINYHTSKIATLIYTRSFAQTTHQKNSGQNLLFIIANRSKSKVENGSHAYDRVPSLCSSESLPVAVSLGESAGDVHSTAAKHTLILPRELPLFIQRRESFRQVPNIRTIMPID